MGSLRYLLGAALNCADCTMHLWTGYSGDASSAEGLDESFLSGGEVEELETVSQDRLSSELGEGRCNMRRTSGENMSNTFKFCNQPRLVRLLSGIERVSVFTSCAWRAGQEFLRAACLRALVDGTTG